MQDTRSIMQADRKRRLARIAAEDAALDHLITLRRSVECEGRNHTVPDHLRNPRACDVTKYPRGFRNGGRTIGTADGNAHTVRVTHADGSMEIRTVSDFRKGRQSARRTAPLAAATSTPEAARYTPSYDARHVDTY